MNAQDIINFEKDYGHYLDIKNIRVSYTVNDAFRAKRQKKNISLYELAKKVKIDRGSVCKCEMNKTSRGCLTLTKVKSMIDYVEGKK